MDKHNENCECGCNEGIEDEITVTLTLDDGSELECIVVTIFPVGDKKYIALLPITETEEEESEVYLYRFISGGLEGEEEEGELDLESIEDDAEYEAVADAFDAYLDTQEFDDMMDEDIKEEEK